MPQYEFRCRDCQKVFAKTETYAEHDRHHEKCPHCGSRKIEPLLSAVFAKTSKKS